MSFKPASTVETIAATKVAARRSKNAKCLICFLKFLFQLKSRKIVVLFSGTYFMFYLLWFFRTYWEMPFILEFIYKSSESIFCQCSQVRVCVLQKTTQKHKKVQENLFAPS